MEIFSIGIAKNLIHSKTGLVQSDQCFSAKRLSWMYSTLSMQILLYVASQWCSYMGDVWYEFIFSLLKIQAGKINFNITFVRTCVKSWRTEPFIISLHDYNMEIGKMCGNKRFNCHKPTCRYHKKLDSCRRMNFSKYFFSQAKWR